MPNPVDLLQTYGVLIVFAIVLIEQIGMPIPAFPILIVAGHVPAQRVRHFPLLPARASPGRLPYCLAPQ